MNTTSTIEEVSRTHDWLKAVESPFLWRPSTLLSPEEAAGILPRLLSKDHGLVKKKGFTLNTFVLNLLLGCELYMSAGNSTAAILKLTQLERELDRLDSSSNNTFYRTVCQAQRHVTAASRAILLSVTGHPAESKRVVVPDLHSAPKQLGGLYGIKCLVYLQYGARAAQEALRWAQQAIQASPREPEWYLLAGKAMETMRRSSDKLEGVPKEELTYFEQASKLSDKPNFSLYLAKIYEQIVHALLVQYGHNATAKSGALPPDVNDLSQKAIQVYRNLLHKQPSTETQVRCLEGMLRLPREVLSIGELGTIVEKISKITKKSTKFYNAAATFHLKMKKDKDTALKYLQRGSALGDFICALNVVRMRHELNHDIVLEDELRALVNRFKHDKAHHNLAQVHLGAFYLLKNRDVALALETFEPVMQENPRWKAMLEHKPIVVRSPRPLNLFHLLVNEMRTVEVVPLRNPLHPIAKKKLLTFLRRFHPELIKHPMDVHMIDKIVKISRDLEEKKVTTQPPTL